MIQVDSDFCFTQSYDMWQFKPALSFYEVSPYGTVYPRTLSICTISFLPETVKQTSAVQL